MALANILFGITSFAALALSLFVFISNPRKDVNRSLSALLISTFVWLITNLATNLSSSADAALFFARLTIIGPLFFSFFFFVFTQVFQSSAAYSRKKLLIEMIPIMVLLPFVMTQYNIKSIGTYGSDTVVGLLYTPATIVAVIYVFRAVITLFSKYKKAKSASAKMQIKYIFFGILGAFIPSLITNAILPLIVETNAFLYGPNSVIILAGFMTLAIVRHRLLDIRLIVARSLTYILLLSTVVVVYAAVVIGFGTALLPASSPSVAEQLFYIVMALIIATTYQPLKKFFDKFTNKYFFQDIYDTQTVLDQVSSIIVGNVDPRKIQKGALSAVVDSLRPLHAAFLLYDSSHQLHIAEVSGEPWHWNNQNDLELALGKIGKKIVDYDDPDTGNMFVREVFQNEGIVVAAPLITKDEPVGYLVLGAKKTGSIYSTQDIGLLSIAANELAVALQNAQRFEEIQAFNITLQEKVNEATRELKSTNRKLIELDEAKDEFISMASHQLRTPLTSIKGYLSMLLDGDMGKLGDNQTNALKEAFGSSQRMVFLISDFLNVSRIKTGKFVIETSEVNLAEMVHEELVQLRELAESRNVTFKYDQPKEFPIVKLDDNKLRQVMMNMIDNAIYYTPVGGTVTVQLYVDAKEVVFKVIDTGIGVPKAERHKLFTKFFRAANARVARPDGTGLGLFMAQKVILAQGGTIIFESEEGKGSTFGWRFPLNKIKA